MEILIIVLTQLFAFSIFGIIGVYAVKTNILDKSGLNYLSNFVIKITLPIMLFINTLIGVKREVLLNSISIIYLAIVFYLLVLIVAWGLKRLFKIKLDQGKVYMALVMFGNVGFIGIPMISKLFPQNGMLYIALFTVVDQLLLWTLGITLITPSQSQQSFKFSQLKKMINPSTVAIVVSLILVMLDLQLPVIMQTTLSQIGSITSPLAMIYLGGSFCFIPIRPLVKERSFYGIVLIKMLLLPILFYLSLQAFHLFSNDVIWTFTILMALPTMSSIAMMANANDNYGDFCTGCVFFTTCCSLITIPIVCFVINFL